MVSVLERPIYYGDAFLVFLVRLTSQKILKTLNITEDLKGLQPGKHM